MQVPCLYHTSPTQLYVFSVESLTSRQVTGPELQHDMVSDEAVFLEGTAPWHAVFYESAGFTPHAVFFQLQFLELWEMPIYWPFILSPEESGARFIKVSDTMIARMSCDPIKSRMQTQIIDAKYFNYEPIMFDPKALWGDPVSQQRVVRPMFRGPERVTERTSGGKQPPLLSF